jgi:hypothetical protein
MDPPWLQDQRRIQALTIVAAVRGTQLVSEPVVGPKLSAVAAV